MGIEFHEKMVTLTSDNEAKTLMEAIPYETKAFLLVVTIAALIIFIIVVFIDSKSSCRCFDCQSIIPASVVRYGKLKKKKTKSRNKQGTDLSIITGTGVSSKPLGSSLTSPSSSEQDSDDDVLKSYQKSLAISRQSMCLVLIASGSVPPGKKQNGEPGRVERKKEGGAQVEDKSEGGIFGIFKKKDRKSDKDLEKEGFCFKNQVFNPMEETSPSSVHPQKMSSARSFTDLSSTSTADQSHQTISPLRTLWNKFNSGSTSKLHNNPISLHLTLTYFEAEGELEVKIIEAKDVPQWAVVTRIKITLLPTKKEKFETKPKPGICPIFNESARFKVLPNVDVNSMVLRVRVYGGENRSSLLGWKLINFTRVLRTKSTQFWICLETEKAVEEKLKSSSMQSIVSCSSNQKTVAPPGPKERSVPELLLGLSYNVLTGYMKAHIVAGAQLVESRSLEKVDTGVYVKLSIMADKGQEMTHSRTALKACHHDSSVAFHETFAFQLPLCQLELVTLVVNAFKVREKRKKMIGWFALGSSSSGEKEAQHWNEMKMSKEEVTYWHVLLE